MSTVVLVCAVFAATAAGVLLAYGVCYAMFGLFRIHARQIMVCPSRAAVGERQLAEF